MIGKSPGQTKITEYFDIVALTQKIDECTTFRETINEICGVDKEMTVQPILAKMMQNAEQNSKKTSKAGYRHDSTILKFASSLFCLMGKASYELLQVNLGSGLPSVSTLQKNIRKDAKIKEGDFRFDELQEHLKKWDASGYVHLHLDDTRILKRVEYDQTNDRFVGFCLPIDEEGLSCADAFVLDSFEEIEEAVNTKTVSSYAHCVVVKSIDPVVP